MFFDRLNKWRNRGSGELVAAGVIYGALYLDDWAILGVGGPEGDEFMPVLVQAAKFQGITLGNAVFVLNLETTHTPRCVEDLYAFHEGFMVVNHDQALHSMSADDRDRRIYICQTRLAERLGAGGAVWSDGGQGFSEIIKDLEKTHGNRFEQCYTLSERGEHPSSGSDHHSNVNKAKVGLGMGTIRPIRSRPAMPAPGMIAQSLTEEAQVVLDAFKDLEDNLEKMLKDKPIRDAQAREDFRWRYLRQYLKDALYPVQAITVTL